MLLAFAGMGAAVAISGFQAILWLKFGEWVDADPLAIIALANFSGCSPTQDFARLLQCHEMAESLTNAELASNEDVGLGVIKIFRWLADLWLGFYAMAVAFIGITIAEG